MLLIILSGAILLIILSAPINDVLGERITFHSLIRLIPRNSGNGLIQFTNWAQKIQTDHVSHSIRPIMDRNSQIFGDSINWMNITNEDQIAFIFLSIIDTEKINTYHLQRSSFK